MTTETFGKLFLAFVVIFGLVNFLFFMPKKRTYESDPIYRELRKQIP